MLAAIALAVANNAGQWAAAFVIAFGAWDIAFYVFLKLLLAWPASLFTWDILFLVPVPWVGPVIAPILVSTVMIVSGAWYLRSPARIARWHWAGILCGAVIIVISFAQDYRHVMRGGMPHPFDWPLFALGLALGVASYARAVVSTAQKSKTPAPPPEYRDAIPSHTAPAYPRDENERSVCSDR